MVRNLVIVVACLAAPMASGCGCEKNVSIGAVYEGAPVIFVGYLITAQQLFEAATPMDDSNSSGTTSWAKMKPSQIAATFHVDEMLKGNLEDVPKKILIPEGSCGFDAVIGAPYLIVSDLEGHTTVCDGSHLIGDFLPERDTYVITFRELRASMKK